MEAGSRLAPTGKQAATASEGGHVDLCSSLSSWRPDVILRNKTNRAKGDMRWFGASLLRTPPGRLPSEVELTGGTTCPIRPGISQEELRRETFGDPTQPAHLPPPTHSHSDVTEARRRESFSASDGV
ncbi:unnamed protein product [Pleuronectes platessa]|uniref:Uncharacterized protein n=1 Tax=Pleuronectes platessa TaxID=8262 RepID=A0A9N7UGD4_PLEPL|nr:unnamed protein product [Pleuronectes platessa]